MKKTSKSLALEDDEVQIIVDALVDEKIMAQQRLEEAMYRADGERANKAREYRDKVDGLIRALAEVLLTAKLTADL